MENTLKKIAALFAIFSTVKEQLENILVLVLNDNKLKTITLHHEYNEKGSQ
ncbi:MAG: hypothetical protein ACRDD7_17575 [Peptostreptococcaceae bacterium]